MGNKQSAEKQVHYIMVRTDSHCKRKSPVKGKESVRHSCFRMRWSEKAFKEVTCKQNLEVRGNPGKSSEGSALQTEETASAKALREQCTRRAQNSKEVSVAGME